MQKFKLFVYLVARMFSHSQNRLRFADECDGSNILENHLLLESSQHAVRHCTESLNYSLVILMIVNGH